MGFRGPELAVGTGVVTEKLRGVFLEGVGPFCLGLAQQDTARGMAIDRVPAASLALGTIVFGCWRWCCCRMASACGCPRLRDELWNFLFPQMALCASRHVQRPLQRAR